MSKGVRKFPRTDVWLTGQRILDAIGPLISKWAIVGSYRRGLEMCGDVDFLAIPRDGVSVEACNAALALVCRDGQLESEGDLSIGMVPLLNGDEISVNVFYTTPDEWGSALLYTTGSREFNVLFRGIAKSRGFSVNEHGVSRGGKPVPDSGFSERAVCRTIGVRWVPPEARTGSRGSWVVDYKSRDSRGGPGTTRPVRPPPTSEKPGRRRRF